ncbi:unnamed protein product [Meloidogyne enterolobii]|uniref:Uncharacterized protein n=1 Tax=Meloidogyne enterolobii TaxID=390850 RepID=A0ACB0ZKA4_MELEN
MLVSAVILQASLSVVKLDFKFCLLTNRNWNVNTRIQYLIDTKYRIPPEN